MTTDDTKTTDVLKIIEAEISRTVERVYRQASRNVQRTNSRHDSAPLPTAALVHQIVVDGIGRGVGDQDFAALLQLEAEGAGMELESEDADVSDGLS